MKPILLTLILVIAFAGGTALLFTTLPHKPVGQRYCDRHPCAQLR